MTNFYQIGVSIGRWHKQEIKNVAYELIASSIFEMRGFQPPDS